MLVFRKYAPEYNIIIFNNEFFFLIGDLCPSKKRGPSESLGWARFSYENKIAVGARIFTGS